MMQVFKKAFLGLIMLLLPGVMLGQTVDSSQKAAPKKWYDNMSINGYTIIRYNHLLETNPLLGCEECDRAWGNNTGISMRAARVTLSGWAGDRIFFKFMPDFASNAAGNTHYVQLREYYFDLYVDKAKSLRLRLGQSPLPYSFEVEQSNSQRVPLDRNDATNSGAYNENDLGAFLYWSPKKIHDRFVYLERSGLKGAGDYGFLGFGVYNGQTANRPEANNNRHMIAHIEYPFQLGSQYIQAGIYGYTGIYTVTADQRSVGVKGTNDFRDERANASLVIFPQPIGFQAEYNMGRGPEFNPSTSAIEQQMLQGGYAMLMYRQKIKNQYLVPFVRYQYYDGGKKIELDARSYLVNDLEFGVEWRPIPAFEMTLDYVIADRKYEDLRLPINHQTGRLLRMQVQFSI